VLLLVEPSATPVVIRIEGGLRAYDLPLFLPITYRYSGFVKGQCLYNKQSITVAGAA